MENEKFTFFYRSASPFSQWYSGFFEADGIAYNCAEQYMMHQKAVLFGDAEMAEKILQAKTPSEQKALGRKVRNFDAQVWNENAKKLVYQGNYAKFKNNPKLLEVLMATDGTTLVEASPTDKIWGIGLDENDARAYSRETWQGTNWLGEVLTQLREDLKKELE
jgi:ribA/ribD-fused uncharacterized protein